MNLSCYWKPITDVITQNTFEMLFLNLTDSEIVYIYVYRLSSYYLGTTDVSTFYFCNPVMSEIKYQSHSNMALFSIRLVFLFIFTTYKHHGVIMIKKQNKKPTGTLMCDLNKYKI